MRRSPRTVNGSDVSQLELGTHLFCCLFYNLALWLQQRVRPACCNPSMAFNTVLFFLVADEVLFGTNS